MAEKRFRTSWFIGGSVLVIVLLGLFVDVGRSYTVKKALEIKVRNSTDEAAKFLPFRPMEAVAQGIRSLEERGITADPGSVTVAPDGYSMKISIISEVRSYFAWIVGNPKMKFQAECAAEVLLEGGGPCDEMELNQVGFALVSYKEFAIGQNVVISPSAAPDLPEYALKAYQVTAPGTLRVGELATFAPLDSLKDYASPQEAVVVILAEPEGNQARVQGFADLNAVGLDAEGKVLGRFIRQQISGQLKKTLPQENNFGLLRGGVPKVVLK